jgi:hypothetical protein
MLFEQRFKSSRFEDTSITPNTRVSYPIYHIDNIQPGSIGKTLKTYSSLTDSFEFYLYFKIDQQDRQPTILYRLYRQSCWNRSRCD